MTVDRVRSYFSTLIATGCAHDSSSLALLIRVCDAVPLPERHDPDYVITSDIANRIADDAKVDAQLVLELSFIFEQLKRLPLVNP
ncbi:hypothetical protein [Lignipirellula cremea]|uniref:hypothetical protein n=1 Tax=Lignipirellula cremea TaxID=2528010 RepID=UPI0011A72352|nr:hypothetical protein [Lignipirellula cremea]